MNRRIAKKVYKRWRELYEQDQRIRKFNVEIGPEGKSTRETLASMFKSEVQPHDYEKGWWPKGRLIHHLQIKRRSRYSKVTLQRAFNRLPSAERIEWAIDCRVIEAQIERERFIEENGHWALAARDMERWPGTMSRLLASIESAGET